jgi:hypothetical protein
LHLICGASGNRSSKRPSKDRVGSRFRGNISRNIGGWVGVLLLAERFCSFAGERRPVTTCRTALRGSKLPRAKEWQVICNDLPRKSLPPLQNQKPVLVVVSAPVPESVLTRVEYLRHVLRLGFITALLLPALT